MRPFDRLDISPADYADYTDFLRVDADADSYTESPEGADRDRESYLVIGAAMEVHRELGCGFLEPVYQEALALEFEAREIPHIKEVQLKIQYKETVLDCSYRADFICFESLLVELKSVESLGSSHRSQMINYLNATGFSRGLLINFGNRSLQYERFAHTAKKIKN